MPTAPTAEEGRESRDDCQFMGCPSICTIFPEAGYLQVSSCLEQSTVQSAWGGSKNHLSDWFVMEGECAGERLTTSFSKGKKYLIIAFANSHSINVSTMADFKGPMGHLWERCTELGLESK